MAKAGGDCNLRSVDKECVGRDRVGAAEEGMLV